LRKFVEVSLPEGKGGDVQPKMAGGMAGASVPTSGPNIYNFSDSSQIPSFSVFRIVRFRRKYVAIFPRSFVLCGSGENMLERYGFIDVTLLSVVPCHLHKTLWSS
jgi:hypothetical protein